MISDVTIDVLLVRHPPERISPVIPAMIEHLEGAGARVRKIYPDEHEGDVDELSVPEPGECDVAVLKAKTPAGLDLASRYHAAGIATFNPYPVTELCRDKIATTAALQDAGVPVPETWAVQNAPELAPHLATGPIIVKPYRGSQGAGITIVHEESQLAGIDHGGDVILAQRYHEPDGRDRKIYRIGDEVFCVERIWPPVTFEDKLGRLVELPTHIEEAARACGPALGIDTYGVDIIEHDGDPYVVDLSSFPGFKGVPDAGVRLAERVLAEARA